MILVIDEIANLSTDHTLLVSGQPMIYQRFPQAVRQFGVMQAIASTCPPWAGWHAVTPVTDDSNTPPSMAAALKLAPHPLSQTPGIWPPPTYGPGEWQCDEWGFATWPVGLLPDSHKPAPFPPGMMHNTGNPCILVVRDDGSALVTVVELISYLSSGAQGELSIGNNIWLSGMGLVAAHFEPGRQGAPPLGHVVRLSTWLLSAGQLHQAGAFGDGVQPGPGSWQTPIPASWGWSGPKTRTLVLSQQTPMRDWDGRGFAPSSPILHLRIGVGDTLLLRFARTYDFTGDEVAYEESVRAKQNAAREEMRQMAMRFWEAALKAFKQIDWEELAAEEAYTEL